MLEVINRCINRRALSSPARQGWMAARARALALGGRGPRKGEAAGERPAPSSPPTQPRPWERLCWDPRANSPRSRGCSLKVEVELQFPAAQLLVPFASLSLGSSSGGPSSLLPAPKPAPGNLLAKCSCQPVTPGCLR